MVGTLREGSSRVKRWSDGRCWVIGCEDRPGCSWFDGKYNGLYLICIFFYLM